MCIKIALIYKKKKSQNAKILENSFGKSDREKGV